MPGARTVTRDNQPGIGLFSDWVVSEDHFGQSASSNYRVTREPASSAPRQGHRGRSSGSDKRTAVSAALTQASLPRALSDASTQTNAEAAPAANQSRAPPEGAPANPLSPDPTLAEPAFPTSPQAESSTATDPPPAPSAEAATSSEGPDAASTAPRTPSQAPAEASAPAAAAPTAPATPSAEPPVALLAAPGAAREPSRSQPSPRSPRSRSQVGRDSYQLLWREYLALTEQQQQQRQQQQAESKRGRFRVGRSSSSSGRCSTTAAAEHESEMSTPAFSTIMQGPLPYDKPKGPSALLLPLLCPPLDAIDMQKLTKLFVRVVVTVSTFLVTLSFAIIPAWLWLLRYELMQGHRGDALALLVAGLAFFVAADAVNGAATRADSARTAGVFTASNKSAYQLAPGRQGVASSRGAASAIAAARPATGAAAPAAGASSPAPYTAGQASAVSAASGPGGVRTPSAAARSHHAATNGVDPLVSQVKQRIIKLERILFGNELTEADISRDALGSRVHMLCTEVGVPFGGPGGSSTRPSAAELDQQLRAVENALGVM